MKTYLIIGGSSGIGKSILESLIYHNNIINFSRNKPSIEHNNLTHYTIDILKDELPKLDLLDGLIYCPGSINLKPISHLSEEDFKTDLDINLIGAVKTVKTYLPNLKESEQASIVMFSSVATKLGMPFHCSVAAAKSAVEGFVKSLGAELAPKIRVNAIAPTLTDTNMASKLLRNDKMIQQMEERHPLKRILNPDEVANLATYLLSDNSKGISGQILNIDCGIVSFKI